MIFPIKMMLITSCYLLLAMSSWSMAYMGTRYGKRVGSGYRDLQNQLIGPRESRHYSGTRFYSGSRYGGKRDHWLPFLVSTDGKLNRGSPPDYDRYDALIHN